MSRKKKSKKNQEGQKKEGSNLYSFYTAIDQKTLRKKKKKIFVVRVLTFHPKHISHAETMPVFVAVTLWSAERLIML